jgi:hypothetical protein
MTCCLRVSTRYCAPPTLAGDTGYRKREHQVMAATLIYGDRASQVTSALEAGDALWISEQDLTASTGWERKPQGLCLGDRCVPIPPSREGEFVASDGRFNIAAFSRYLDQPVVHDDAASTWLVGESAAERTGALRSLTAPDFRLPDLDGNMHALSDYRGKKVLLLSWASW